MKKLFIYYSLSGNGDAVAKYLEEKDYEVRKVESKLKLSKNLFLSMMKGGFLAFVGAKPKLIGFDCDIEGYDDIYIGSPIWNGRLAAPANSILRELDLARKNVTFILYSGSGSGAKALKKINKNYPNSKVIFLKEPKKYPDELQKLE